MPLVYIALVLLALYLVYKLLVAVVTFLLWVGSNFYVTVAALCSTWELPGILSWALSGLAIGSLAHFAFVEANRLPNFAPSVLVKGFLGLAILLVCTFVVAKVAVILAG